MATNVIVTLSHTLDLTKDLVLGEEPSSFRLPLTSLCDLPLLFVYFQVNNCVLYFLDYCEDIYVMALSVLVSM